MKKLRFCIIGMGIGRFQGRAIQGNPRGEVVALCDLIESRMQEFAGELGTGPKLYTDYREMLRDPDIDAVFVGTPNVTHVPIALDCMRAGKHVLSTKPLAGNLEAAEQAAREAEKAGVVSMMSLSLRFDGKVQYLGEITRSGQLGNIYYTRARSVRRSGIPDWGSHFVEAGGGALRDMGVHLLDSSWWLMGRPRPVSAAGASGAHFGPKGVGYNDFKRPEPGYAEKFAADDFGGGILRFENGAVIQLESHWACNQPDDLQIELFGTDAGVKLEPLTLYRTINGAPADTSITVPHPIDGMAGVAEHFLACVLDGAKCDAPLSDGLMVQRMLEGLLESARLGREVPIEA